MVFDPLGGPNTRGSFRALKPGGRLVSYGFMATGPGSPVITAVRQLAELRLRSLGSRKGRFYRLSDSVRRDPDAFRADLADLLDLLRRKRISPVIAAVLPLSEAGEAHRRLEGRAVTGRLLLLPDRPQPVGPDTRRRGGSSPKRGAPQVGHKAPFSREA